MRTKNFEKKTSAARATEKYRRPEKLRKVMSTITRGRKNHRRRWINVKFSFFQTFVIQIETIITTGRKCGEKCQIHTQKKSPHFAVSLGTMRNHAHSRERRKVEDFGCNCPGVVRVIEDIDRKSAPVKFGSGLGPIRRPFRRVTEMPAAVPILPQSLHLQ